MGKGYEDGRVMGLVSSGGGGLTKTEDKNSQGEEDSLGGERADVGSRGDKCYERIVCARASVCIIAGLCADNVL